MKYKVILWDFDGTLANTGADVWILWNMRLGSWEAAWMRSSKAATATSVSR